jgi:hypothetical protein
MKKSKWIGIEKFIKRNKMLKKIGIDTDNCLSWIENEKLTPGYRPSISKRKNFLCANYVVFSELMHLLSKKDSNVTKLEVISFLRKNHIFPIKKKDVNQTKVENTLNNLKIERKKNGWSAGDTDLKIISVYDAAGIDCISTDNLKHFKDPCNYLGISLDFPPIIQPGSRQDTGC